MSALTPAKLDAATVAFSTLFRETLRDTPTHYQELATEIPSTTREMRHAWLDRIPQLREWLGERVVNNLAIRLQSIENKLFEDTVGVKRTDIEDDLVGVYRPVIEELAQQSKLWPDKLVVDAMQAGTSTVGYDNQDFFSASHPVNMDNALVAGPGGAVTQANLLTGSALASDTLETAIQTMMSYCGADGKPLEIVPSLLVVPPQLKFKAARMLQAEILAYDITLTGATHSAAPQSNVLKGSLDLLVLPRLMSDATSWYVLCTTRAIKPFIFQNRESPEFAALTKPDDENVFKRDEYLYGVRARGAAGLGPWFLALKATA